MKHMPIIIALLLVQKITAQHYHISGKVIGLKDSTMILLRNVERNLPFDTTYVMNGKFSFKGQVPNNETETFFIRTTPYKNYLSQRFFVENTRVKVVLNAEEEPRVSVSGGTFQTQANAYKAYVSAPMEEKEVIRNKIRKEEDMEKRNKLLTERSAWSDSVVDYQHRYIKMHPDENYTAYLINELRINLKNEEVQQYYDDLNEQVKQSKYGKILANYLKKSVDFTKGTPIVDFTLKDINGNNVSLSSFKGKYVLLDFWGSWCGSCRSKYPMYSKIYEKYKDQGFEIVGVSLDRYEDKWKRAVEKDKLKWVNLIDPTGFLGDVAVTYKIFTVPISYLIDPEGKVVQKMYFTNRLEDSLAKVLNSND